MRIRKNAKLTELLFPNAPAGEKLPTHVCRLNQSRWDVMNFFPEKPRPSSSRPKSDGEDSLTANGSLGDSIGAVQSSVASMEKPDFMNIDEKEEVDVRGKLEGNKENPILFDTEFGSKRKDRRCSQCKSKTDHVSLLKSCGNNKPTSGRLVVAATKSSISPSSPYEFCSYSGLLPKFPLPSQQVRATAIPVSEPIEQAPPPRNLTANEDLILWTSTRTKTTTASTAVLLRRECQIIEISYVKNWEMKKTNP